MAARVLNLPNALTTLRVLLLPLMAAFVAKGWGFLAVVVWTTAAATDYFDGYFARQYKQETAFGKLMDPVADKLMLCVATVYLLAFRGPLEIISPLLATLLLAREFLVTGLRAMAAAEGLVIGAGQTGKIKTVLQFVGLGFLMISLDDLPQQKLSHQLGLVTLWASVVLSYLSMAQYIRAAYLELKNKLR
jgi:CDP-diacylglycerol--glycerol-3-phosphate 3-phosphatidyltransferase